MRTIKDGNKGPVPKWAKDEVLRLIAEAARCSDTYKQIAGFRGTDSDFYLAFHWFAYDSIVENMDPRDVQIWRAFDQFAREHNIPEN